MGKEEEDSQETAMRDAQSAVVSKAVNRIGLNADRLVDLCVAKLQERDWRAFGLVALVGIGVVRTLGRWVFGRRGRSESAAEVKPEDPFVEKQLLFAGARAVESRRMDRLFYDPIAIFIAGGKWTRKASRLEAWKLPAYSIRGKLLDDFLTSALKRREDIRQIVSVGCSLDTRAFRLHFEDKDLRFFDVDHEQVIEYKRRVLDGVSATLKTKMPLSIAVGTADLGMVGWDTELVVAGFNWNEKSLWIVDDPYSQDEEVLDVIFRTACTLMTSGSMMITSFSGTPEYSSFDPKQILRNCGYQVKGCTNIGEPRASYGRWVGEPADICVIYASPRSRKASPEFANSDGMLSTVTDTTDSTESFASFEFTEEIDDEGTDHDHVELHTVHLQLEVQAPLFPSGNICIVGDHRSLGEWDPSNAFPIGLASSEGCIFAELCFPISVDHIEYKYVVVDGTDCHWEQGENRVLALEAGTPVTTHDEWYY